ncbi:chromate transporter [Metabacillus malikii]|uniref:Chromate transporter n=1 Tax=Metabacillus malikii TaxID=1504265 RepID=A0ABT9ZFP4_9BACI|nr:chromate transporter [Metabacillus malikii]MDQ0230704.1 chromate transporter [Metabacillus malikii]
MEFGWKKLFQIFWTFLKIGPVTFGGGYAMIPLIKREVTQHKKWLSEDDISEVLALSESIPGAIALNSSTFIGYKIGGVKGAIAALLGIFLPTFFIVILMSMMFLQLQYHPKVEAALHAIQASIVALIVYACYSNMKTAIIDKSTFLMAISAFAVLLFLNIHPILLILFGILFGVVLTKLKILLGYQKPESIQEKADTNENREWYMGEGI